MLCSYTCTALIFSHGMFLNVFLLTIQRLNDRIVTDVANVWNTTSTVYERRYTFIVLLPDLLSFREDSFFRDTFRSISSLLYYSSKTFKTPLIPNYEQKTSFGLIFEVKYNFKIDIITKQTLVKDITNHWKSTYFLNNR